MIEQLSITILVDNRSGEQEAGTEHGLALWIEADGYRLLFDTGQSDLLFRNAKLLGIDLMTADALVLSHGHYDHTGGLADLLDASPALPVYCHPGVVLPRYSRRSDGSMKPVGMSSASAQMLMRNENRISWVSAPRYITRHIGSTGVIPRMSDFEDTGGPFYTDPAGTRPDTINDDSALWIETVQGVVVIVGCCHSGIVNTLSCIHGVTGTRLLHGIVGGMHLVHASGTRLDATVAWLQRENWNGMVPCHCTGEEAVNCLQEHFPGRVEPGFVGKIIHSDDL